MARVVLRHHTGKNIVDDTNNNGNSNNNNNNNTRNQNPFSNTAFSMPTASLNADPAQIVHTNSVCYVTSLTAR